MNDESTGRHVRTDHLMDDVPIDDLIGQKDEAVERAHVAEDELAERNQWADSLARYLDVPEDLNPFFGIDRIARELPRMMAELEADRADLAARLERAQQKVEELRDRRNEDMELRGVLSPNGGDRAVPFELGASLVPAVEWLVAEQEWLRYVVEPAVAWVMETTNLQARTDDLEAAVHTFRRGR